MIAVDANGADAGPGAVADGVRRSGERVLLFGPAGEIGDLGSGVEVVDAPERIGGDEEPVRAVRSRPEASIVRSALFGRFLPMVAIVSPSMKTSAM